MMLNSEIKLKDQFKCQTPPHTQQALLDSNIFEVLVSLELEDNHIETNCKKITFIDSTFFCIASRLEYFINYGRNFNASPINGMWLYVENSVFKYLKSYFTKPDRESPSRANLLFMHTISAFFCYVCT
jgi:hypothetical protein